MVRILWRFLGCLYRDASQAFMRNLSDGLSLGLFALLVTWAPFAGPAVAQSLKVRIITSGTSDTLTSADQPNVTISWKTSSTGVKTENLYACTSSTSVKADVATIKDANGTAATYPIMIKANGTDTIDNVPNTSPFTLNANFESITLQCDGTGNWMAE